MIVLHKTFQDTRLRHGLLVVAFEEKSTLVTEHAWFQDEHSRQGRKNLLDRFHIVEIAVGIAARWSAQTCSLRTPSPAASATGTPRSYCSSSNSQSSPPAPP